MCCEPGQNHVTLLCWVDLRAFGTCLGEYYDLSADRFCASNWRNGPDNDKVIIMACAMSVCGQITVQNKYPLLLSLLLLII